MGPRVLLVDDSPVALLAVSRRLSDAGLTVVCAASARDGVRTETAGLRAALLDLDLGDGFGTEVAEALRGRADVPIAFFSAGAPDEQLDRARAFGPVFAKPGDVDAAVAWVVANAR